MAALDNQRILFIAPTPFFADRGCHVRIFEEARALEALGYDVTIVTYHIGRDIGGLDIRRIPALIFWYKKLSAGPSIWKPILDFLLFVQALWISYFNPFCIIHAHLHEGCLIGFLCSRLRLHPLPLVFDMQGSLTDELVQHGWIGINSILHTVVQKVERFIACLPDAIIASNKSVLIEAMNGLEIEPSKVHLVPDAVDVDVFTPRPRSQTLLQELSIPEDSIVVVYLGLLTAYQGIDMLLEAFQRVAERFSNVHLLLMGYPNEKRYRDIAIELGIGDLVILKGRVDYADAPALLSIGDLAVSPKMSESEGNGKLYNYLAMGLPIVAFDTPANRAILGRFAVYPSNMSVDALAEAIEELCGAESRRVHLAREGRQRAVELFSWNERAKGLVEVYAEVLDKYEKGQSGFPKGA